MVRGTLRFEDVAFNAEGKFGSVIIAKPDGNGGTDVTRRPSEREMPLRWPIYWGERWGRF